MPFLGESSILFGGFTGSSGGYVIEGSAYGNGSSKVAWTPSGTGDSRTSMAAEVIFKHTKLGTLQRLFCAGDAATGNNFEWISIDANNKLDIHMYSSAVLKYHKVSTQVLRDPSAFYQVVVIRSGSTFTVYLNGTEITAWDTDTGPGASDTGMFGHTEEHDIGGQSWSASNRFYDSIARVTYIDGGGSLTIADFGEAVGNGWVVADVSGLTYGTNGICFEGGASISTGAESFGSSQTASVTGTVTATNDSPTDDAANDIGNYATPSSTVPGNASDTFAEGNLVTGSSSGGNRCRIVPFALQTGKWYWEISYNGGAVGSQVGLLGNADTLTSNYPGFNADSLGVHTYDGDLYDGSGGGGILENRTETTANTDVWGVAWDADNRKLWVSLNGTFFDSGDPAAGTNADFTSVAATMMFPVVTFDTRTDMKANFGQTAFNSTPPTGFNAPSTANLPAPTVTDPSKYFQAHTRTGTGAAANVSLTDASGAVIFPDLVITKNRDTTDEWKVTDRLRGATKELNIDSTNTESTDANGLTAFYTSGSYSHTLGSGADGYNDSGEGFLDLAIVAGGAGSANSDGTVSSTVSVADHGGFSIIKHTNTSGNYTVGHGMAQAPGMLIVKGLNAQGWQVWTPVLGVDGYLAMHTTDTVANPAGDPWADTSPTSSVFTLAGTTWFGDAATDIIVYAFVKTSGLIGIGSYTGNGSADGPNVIIDDDGAGFRPAFVMIKRMDAGSENWSILNNKSDSYNVADAPLLPNAAVAESAATWSADFTANGFKVRSATTDNNTSGGTYIYLAFAEVPFGGASISQARAR